MKLEPASKLQIKFRNEKQRYTVQAQGKRFLVCTKPFNPKKTVLYTIIDLKEKIRGPEGVVFSIGAETKEQCEEMLDRIQTGETEISHRNRRTLDIEMIYAEYGSKQA